MAKQTLGDSTCVTIGGSMLDVQVLTVIRVTAYCSYCHCINRDIFADFLQWLMKAL